MALHNELGAKGEYEALRHLMDEGYTLLAKNWRTGHLEIDIVAEWHGEIVFVEVKTRRNEIFALATDAVTLKKKRNIIAAGHAFLKENHLIGHPYSYDVITVIGTERPYEISHIRRAYTEREVWREIHRKRAFEV